ncbi:MAG: hypothetical protein K8S14_07675 [Actinomycetia bacterium]|nr:hypothetical protein [Actinomycetes bacterium]
MWRLSFVGVLVVVALFFCFPDSVFASNDVYRLLDQTFEFNLIESGSSLQQVHFAKPGSRFVILDDTGDSLIVRFTGGLPDNPEPFGDRYDPVGLNIIYSISKANLPFYQYEKAFAFTYGLSVVPTKLMFMDGNFGGSASLGAYFGREQTIWHIPFSIVSYLGFTLIPGSDSEEESSRTGLGFSLGGGILLAPEPSDRIQFGIFAGIDHANDPQIQEIYKYNHKWWIGLGIGYRLR